MIDSNAINEMNMICNVSFIVHRPFSSFYKDYSDDISTDKAGEFEFSCGMDMFSGKVVIQ